ncbi:MAG: hypothetical protein LBU15_02780 [Rickettsiales bacterium]|jgi:hypothetical protein|nr:hypothetical protein [Rickettsiales bacterium]
MKFVRIILIIISMALCFVVGVEYERLAGKNVVPPFPINVNGGGATEELPKESGKTTSDKPEAVGMESPASASGENIDSAAGTIDSIEVINEVPAPLTPEESLEGDLTASPDEQFLENPDAIDENIEEEIPPAMPDDGAEVLDRGTRDVEVPAAVEESGTSGSPTDSRSLAAPAVPVAPNHQTTGQTVGQTTKQGQPGDATKNDLAQEKETGEKTKKTGNKKQKKLH